MQCAVLALLCPSSNMDLTGVPIGDRGPAMQLRSGRPFCILDPRVEDIHLDDIAHHLAYINRFTGAAEWGVSVAAHSLVVQVLYQREVPNASPMELCAALMHDAHEAYTGDIGRPMKATLNILAPGVLSSIERRIDREIQRKFNLPAVNHDALKMADNTACAIEKEYCLEPSKFQWPAMLAVPKEFNIEDSAYVRAPDVARQWFRRRALDLMA